MALLEIQVVEIQDDVTLLEGDVVSSLTNKSSRTRESYFWNRTGTSLTTNLKVNINRKPVLNQITLSCFWVDCINDKNIMSLLW